MEKKPKRRTRERILETALRLFNEYGEPGVTTTAIADEMNISPGNLYYHYHSKDKIVEALFLAYRDEIERTLAAPERRPVHAEDVWLFLHLVFESIHKYRFLYRDINELVSSHRVLETQFKRILAHKKRTAVDILQGLVQAGEMTAGPMDVEALAVNMTVLATYWLSYEFARDPRSKEESRALARGAFHVISLAAPYLATRERELFDNLAQRYLK
jgi:AcrR family transcriptional regulator